MAKRIKILHNIFVRGDEPGQMITLYANSVFDVDDALADELRGGGVARLAPDAPLLDTTPVEPASKGKA